jgi:hypothetical protein
MQSLFHSWATEGTLSLCDEIPYCTPEAHAAFVSGPSLRKVNRQPADHYFRQRELPNFQVEGTTSSGTVVVISNVPDRKMSEAEARSWSQALCLCGQGLRLHLQALHIVAVNSDGPCHIDWKACEEWLLAASVVFLKAPFCEADLVYTWHVPAPGRALAGACQHTCFIVALDLPNKPASCWLSRKLASKEKPGPKKGVFRTLQPGKPRR